MTHQDSWPPVANDPQPPRASLARWAWIPAILLVPLVGVGAYVLSRGDAEPPAQPAEPDALGALVPQNEPPPPAAVPAPKPAVENTGLAAEDDSADDDSAAVDDDSADDSADDAEPEAAGSDEGADDTGTDDSASKGEDEGFWIQVASLRLKEKADRMAARLKNKGHDAQSVASGGPRSGWWHVVRIGPYVTRLEAEKAKLAFVRAERGSAAVVPRAHGPFNIQIASLRSEARAKTAAARLNRMGHNARVGTLKTSKRGVWHTIRVGPFDFESDAWGYLELLEKDGVKGEISPRPKGPPPAEVPAVVEEEEPTKVEDEAPPEEESESF